MKIVASSDWHLDAMTYGRRRLGELETSIMRTVDCAIERRADLWVFGGDAMNPDSGPRVFACMCLMCEVAQRLAEARIPSLFIAGNHDVVEDGSGDTTLSPLRAFASSGYVRVLEQPTSFIVNGIWVHALPFTATSHAYDVEAHVRSIEPPPGSDFTERPHLVLSHLTRIEGVTPGEEENEMSRGRQITLPRRLIGDHFRKLGVTPEPFILQGHIHKRQLLPAVDGMPAIQIIGSAAQLTHGEEDHDPAFLVVDLDAALSIRHGDDRCKGEGGARGLRA